MAAKNKPQGGDNVVNIKRDGADKIEPEPGWNVQSGLGMLRHAQGDEARLVRLADVVRYLVDSKELPFGVAVERLLSCLEGGAGGVVYRIDEAGYAVAMDAVTHGSESADKFFGVPAEPDQRRIHFVREAATRIRAWWLAKPHELARLVNHPQYQSAEDFKPGKESPFDYCERTGGEVARFALPFRVVHELFGWGRKGASEPVSDAPPVVTDPALLTDWPSLVAYRQANPKATWGKGRQLEILRAELAKRGDTPTVREAMAKELYGPESGRSAIDGVLSRKRKRAKASTMPTPGTFSAGTTRQKAG